MCVPKFVSTKKGIIFSIITLTFFSFCYLLYKNQDVILHSICPFCEIKIIETSDCSNEEDEIEILVKKVELLQSILTEISLKMQETYELTKKDYSKFLK